jgi:DNA-binding transcriptional regulator GbsR (MarR family)
MKYVEGRRKFIDSWGQLASEWGVSRTMGQIHGLLLCSSEALCADEILKILEISRGNANQNIRALVEWGLVHKINMDGRRKDYFMAEKNMWIILRCIIENRKRKELEPLIEVLQEVSLVESQCPDSDEFCKLIRQLYRFSTKANATLDAVISMESDDIIQRMFASSGFDTMDVNPATAS